MIRSRTLLILPCIFIITFVKSQELQHISRINGEFNSVGLNYTELFKAFDDLYFTTHSGGHQRIQFGDSILSGNRFDTLVDYNRQDQFFVKIDSEHKILNYWVIDNCENFDDFTTIGNSGIILVNVHDYIDGDSLALMTMPDGTIIRREDHLGQSVLIKINQEFDYIKHTTPTSGRIIQIEGGNDFLYMVIQIQNYKDYILVGTDTVVNFSRPPFGPFASYVLAKYDIEEDKFLWWNRLGSDWEDQLWDFKLDKQESLIVLIHPGDNIYFGEKDTISAGTGPFFNIVLKADKDGNYVWNQSFVYAEGEYLSNLILDQDDNIYVIGNLYGDYLTLFDTLIIAQGNKHGQGIAIKLNSLGDFEWVFHLPGDNMNSSFSDMISHPSNGKLYFSGNVNEGSIILSDDEYFDDDEFQSTYLVEVDRESGSDLAHVWFSQTSFSKFIDLEISNNEEVVAYLIMRDSGVLLDQELIAIEEGRSGFLLTLSTLWDSISSTQALTDDLFRIYPNPVSQDGVIAIEVGENYSSKAVNINILDMKGFVVDGIQNIYDMHSITIADLIPGMYMLIVDNGSTYQLQTFVIQ